MDTHLLPHKEVLTDPSGGESDPTEIITASKSSSQLKHFNVKDIPNKNSTAPLKGDDEAVKTLIEDLLGSSGLLGDSESRPSISFHPSQKPDKPLQDRGKVSYILDILQPQVNLQSDECNGRLLLVATKTRAIGRQLEQGGGVVGILSLDTDDFHAYVCPTDVDLSAGVQWMKWKHADATGEDPVDAKSKDEVCMGQ